MSHRLTIIVVQQQVSQRYVEPDSAPQPFPQPSIAAVKLECKLTRSRLLEIINDLGLYGGEKEQQDTGTPCRQNAPGDRYPGAPRQTPGREDFDAFTIAFTAPNPHLAQRVASRLTSLFIENNLKVREEKTANTSKFLERSA